MGVASLLFRRERKKWIVMSRELSVYPPIHRLGAPGRWIRSHLLAGILHGTPVLLRIQSLRFPSLDTAMKMISFLGEEEFYTLLVAFVVWVVDARLGWRLTLLMAVGFYLAGMLKNLLCLPRPPSPPITPLHQCNDWALPSHHAVLSVVVPWYIWCHVLLYHGNDTSPINMVILFTVISLWSFCVMFSRMYLGVHSPADILSGGVVGCLLLGVWLQIDSAVDGYIASSPMSGLVILSVLTLMLCVHPDPQPTTIIFAETVCMVGVSCGSVLGRCYAPNHVLYAVLEKQNKFDSLAVLFVCSVTRFVLGLLCLLLSKTAMKLVVSRALSYLCLLAGVPTICLKRLSQVSSEKVHYSQHFITLNQPPSNSSQKPHKWTAESPLNLDIPVKFISYIAMGTVAVAIAPALFDTLGI